MIVELGHIGGVKMLNKQTILKMFVLCLMILGVGFAYTQVQNKQDNLLPMISSPANQESQLNITVNCELDDSRKQVPVIQIERPLVTIETARQLSETVFDISNGIEKTDIGPSNMTIIRSGNKVVEFMSLVDIIYHEDVKTKMNTWSDDEIISISNEFLSRIKPYWISQNNVNTKLVDIAPARVTKYTNGTVNIESVAAIYATDVNGIELYGPGADFTVVVADDRVILAELRLPLVEIVNTKEVISEVEAFERFRQGQIINNNLGLTSSYDSISTEDAICINHVSLCYYLGHATNNEVISPQLVYKLQGTIDSESGSYYFVEFVAAS